MTPGHVVSFNDAVKGTRCNPQESIARPYLNGKIGKVQGIDTFEKNTVLQFASRRWYTAVAASTGYTTNSATALRLGSSIIVQTGTTTIPQGRYHHLRRRGCG